MKVLPAVPGHFSRYEWFALGVWVALGTLLGRWEYLYSLIGKGD
jgi:hypothetical protein